MPHLAHCSPLIVAQTGAGKTNFAKLLASVTPRLIILDRKNEYDGPVFDDFRELLDFLLEHPQEDFHAIFRDRRPLAHLGVMDMVAEMQEKEKLPPLAILAEESSYYSETNNISPIVNRAYTAGRHGQLSMMSVIQHPSQIHPIIRSSSDMWISLRMREVTSVMKEVFPKEDQKRIPLLKTLFPGTTPVYGTHFLTDTGEPDPIGVYARALRG